MRLKQIALLSLLLITGALCLFFFKVIDRIESYHNAAFGYSKSILESKEKGYFLTDYKFEPLITSTGVVEFEETWLEEIDGHRIFLIKIQNSGLPDSTSKRLSFDFKEANEVFLGEKIQNSYLFYIICKDLYRPELLLTNSLTTKRILVSFP